MTSDANSISFKYTNPKNCYNNVSITCNNTDAELNSTGSTGECKHLTPGLNYLIKAVVEYSLNQTEHNLTKFTSEFFC